MVQANTLPFALPGFAIDHVEEHENRLTVQAHSIATWAACPCCEQVSRQVHSHYTRSPRDLPSSGRSIQLVLRVQRFRCPNEHCQRKTFAERILQVVPVHGQRTHRLTATLEAVGFELSAEAGARVTRRLNMAVSGETLLRVLRQTDRPLASSVRVLGVDDWAFRKGRRYGTMLVDLEQHRVIDLLPDRTASTLAAWLQAHPEVAIVSRDRSGEYKVGIRLGAPQAVQVADRWHLLKNLGEALQRMLARHPKALRLAARQVDQRLHGEPAPSPAVLDNPLTASVAPPPVQPTAAQIRFAEVKALAAQGLSRRAIARQLPINRATVARYLQLTEPPVRVLPPQNRSSVTPYLAYLQQRWVEGCSNGKQLWRELCAQGYPGSYMSVRRALQKFRTGDGRRQQRLPPAPPMLSPRQAMWLLVKAPDQLTADQTMQREALCACCPQAALAYPLAQRFAAMIHNRQVDDLDAWLADARTSEVAALRHFAAALQQDDDAVRAALTLCWSNGPVEGHVNRLKVIKRMMYGRANFDLLRLRVLHPP